MKLRAVKLGVSGEQFVCDCEWLSEDYKKTSEYFGTKEEALSFIGDNMATTQAVAEFKISTSEQPAPAGEQASA